MIRYRHKVTGQVCEYEDPEAAAVFLKEIQDPPEWELIPNGAAVADAVMQEAAANDTAADPTPASPIVGSPVPEPAQIPVTKGREELERDQSIRDVAQMCYEEVASFVARGGSDAWPVWNEAPEGARMQAIALVGEILANPSQTAEAKYNASKAEDAPAYNELSLEQREIDDILYATARVGLEAAGLLKPAE